MKKGMTILICVVLVTLMCLASAGCKNAKPTVLSDVSEHVTQVGQIPDDFRSIVENNLFNDVIAFENRLLKTEIVEANEEHKTVTHRIQMMDLY